MDVLTHFNKVIRKNLFINYRNDRPRKPSTVMIGTTNLCNLNCHMCGTKNISAPRGHMKMGLYRKIIDQCTELEIDNIALHTVGEPLLHKQIIEQINYAKINKRHIFFSTNGQLLTANTINLLMSTSLDAIRISIEGANKKAYEKNRRGASFQVLLNNLKLLKKVRDTTNSGCNIHITSVLTKDTISDVINFKKLFKPLCDDMYFSHIANPGNQIPGINENQYLIQPRKKIPCRLLWNTMVIGFDGKISVCCLDFNNHLIVGDVNKSPLIDVWQNKTYRRFRRLHYNNKFQSMPLCAECNKEVNSNWRLFWLNFKMKFK